MNKIIRYSTIILFLFFSLPTILLGQTIEIKLPYYAAREYYFCLLEGTKQDTIAKGELDYKGQTSITLPENYRGIGRFTVREYGKKWNIIINGNENIVMSEIDDINATTVFSNSTENNYLLSTIAKQSEIMSDYTRELNQPQSRYSPFSLLAQRKFEIATEYTNIRKEISNSPLYAARIIEILNCISENGSSFNISQDQVSEEQREFIVNDVNFNDLYRSGFWQLALETWYENALLNNTEDSLLVDDSRTMLDRCDNNLVQRELTQTIIRLFSKYGKDTLLTQLGSEYITIPLNGELAPPIIVGNNSFLPKNTLIIFHESGCKNCNYELKELKEKYNILTANNIKVISIAADVNKDIFNETAATFPWTDKICDFTGLDGINFKNLGIVGTPTYILTDSEGIIRGRYAQLKELLP